MADTQQNEGKKAQKPQKPQGAPKSAKEGGAPKGDDADAGVSDAGTDAGPVRR